MFKTYRERRAEKRRLNAENKAEERRLKTERKTERAAARMVKRAERSERVAGAFARLKAFPGGLVRRARASLASLLPPLTEKAVAYRQVAKERYERWLDAAKAPSIGFSTESADMADAMLRSMQRQKRQVYSVIVVFLGGFILWASVFQLASAAIAPGVISPEGSKRPVQHLEGGIVADVLIKDGDHVEGGQSLVVLEDVRARAEVGVLSDQRQILKVRLQRLMSERDGADSFAPQVDGEVSDEVAEAVAFEAKQFESRRQSLEGQIVILKARISQLDNEIKGLGEQVEAVDVQSDLIGEELKGVRELVEKGLARRPQLLALERRQAELDGTRAGAVARIARSREAIGELDAQIASMKSQFIEMVDKSVAEVRDEIIRIENELEARQDVLTRTVVKAPEAGTVVGLKVSSKQAVVRPGDILLEIVPDNAELLVDAQVSPLDIDDVHQGQKAQVHLLAYKQRHMPRVEGVVRYVSADRYVEERTGTAYYLARVAVDIAQVKELAPDVEILSGMPAEVMISTGEQTFLRYLVDPLFQSLRRSFRES